jgi:hypothetical protein
MRILGVVVVVGCSSSMPMTMPMLPAGITARTGLDNPHVGSCTDPALCGRDEPPAGGPHCGTTLACRVFTAAQGRCQYLHNMEHGHLVLAYNCPSGCDDVVQALAGFHASLPSPKRALVTPDPLLQTKVAAMVWGYTWAGDAVDVAKLDALRTLQDMAAPEAGLGCSQ